MTIVFPFVDEEFQGQSSATPALDLSQQFRLLDATEAFWIRFLIEASARSVRCPLQLPSKPAACQRQGGTGCPGTTSRRVHPVRKLRQSICWNQPLVCDSQIPLGYWCFGCAVRPRLV